MVRPSQPVHDPATVPKELHRRAAEPVFGLNDQSNFQVNSIHVGPQGHRLDVLSLRSNGHLSLLYGDYHRIFTVKIALTSLSIRLEHPLLWPGFCKFADVTLWETQSEE